MTWQWILFFFVVFGSKVVLAAVTIYVLLSAERSCSQCDAATVPIRMGAAGRAFSWLTRGRLQRRWCPACGWEGITRTGRLDAAGARVETGRAFRVRG